MENEHAHTHNLPSTVLPSRFRRLCTGGSHIIPANNPISPALHPPPPNLRVCVCVCVASHREKRKLGGRIY